VRKFGLAAVDDVVVFSDVLGLLKMMKIEKLLSCVRSKKNGDER
jgi:hypothetical protein